MVNAGLESTKLLCGCDFVTVIPLFSADSDLQFFHIQLVFKAQDTQVELFHDIDWIPRLLVVYLSNLVQEFLLSLSFKSIWETFNFPMIIYTCQNLFFIKVTQAIYNTSVESFLIKQHTWFLHLSTHQFHFLEATNFNSLVFLIKFFTSTFMFSTLYAIQIFPDLSILALQIDFVMTFLELHTFLSSLSL